MIKEIYKLRVVIILAIVAVLMAATRFKYRNYQWPTPTASQLGEQTAGQASPTIVPTPTVIKEEVYPLYDLLPYKGSNFIVNSYVAPYTLSVVTSGNIKAITKEVNAWMIKNKVATESHNLIFTEKL